MSGARWMLVSAGVLAVVLALFLLRREQRGRDERGANGKVSPGHVRPSPALGAGAARVQNRARHSGERRGVDPEARQRADDIRARLHLRLPRASPAERPANPPTTAEPARGARMPAPQGSGNQAKLALGEYVQSIVRQQFLPMARGCYEELLERQPGSRGTLALHIVVLGDASVGGVVDSVQVNSDSTIHDPEALTCLVESMMALSFDAPPEGRERVEFDYPFTFSPD